MPRTVATSRTQAVNRLPVGDRFHQNVAGVWALKACSTLAQVQASDVVTALAFPGVKGFSIRISWSLLWQNGGPFDVLGLLAAAKAMLNPGQGLMVRFVAGTQSPTDVLAAVRTYVATGNDPCATGSNGTSTATDATSLTDGTKGFTVNGQVTLTVESTSSGITTRGVVTSNTATKLTCSGGWSNGTPNVGAAYSVGQVLPVPFMADGTPNVAFEALYTTMMQWFVGQAQSLGAAMVHAPWYGDQFAELNNGLDLRSVSGYSYANILLAHQRMFDIAYNVCNPIAMPFEHALSGCGPLTTVQFPLELDLSTYMASKYGNKLGLAYVQANGFTIQPWGWGLFGTSTQSTEIQARPGYGLNIRHGAQMINPLNFSASKWNQMFNALVAMRAEYLEVYTGVSFTGSGATQLATEIAAYNKYTAARTFASTRPVAT